MTTTNENRSNEPAQATLVSPAPRKNKAMRAYLVLAAFAGVAVAIYFIHGYLTRNNVVTDDAQIDADVVPVATRVPGLVLHMRVTDNQQVKAGDVIAEIDPAELATKVAAAEADLAAARAQADAADAQAEIVKSTSAGNLSSARAQLQGTSASVRAAAAEIEAANAGLARARSDLAKAEADLVRAKTLHDQGAITKQALESAQSADSSARAAVDLANANLAAARDARQLSETRVGEAQGHVQQSAPVEQQIAVATATARLAHARVDNAQTVVDHAKLELGYTKITSPATGFVSRLGAHEGQLVQAGTTLVMVVPGQPYVVANFKETQIERIRPGDDVEITVDAIGGTFHGTVDSVSAATGARFSMLPPDNSTGNFVKVVQRVPVKIRFTEGGDQSLLRAGLSVEVTVHLK